MHITKYIKDRAARLRLAKTLGVAETTCWRWEKGTIPTPRMRAAIAKATKNAVSEESWGAR